MAVFRVERNTGYTVMSNHHLRNKELSLKAKGLLSQMLSLPEMCIRDRQRKQHFLEKSLHILTLNPCKSSVRMPTRYQSAAISIRVGFHLPLTMTSKHSPQCRPP